MSKKVQIVNGDDLRGAAGGQQQRVRRVDHVERAARQRFGCRPLEAMPEQIQDADWNAKVDAPGATELWLPPEAVLPGAREERDAESPGGVSPRSCEQCGRELVGVFACARALPQRRTVVNEHSHRTGRSPHDLSKSFPISILF
jgi:hypothetical protein